MGGLANIGDRIRGLRISVIVPAYNEARGIGKTLEALSRQRYRDKEIIVVDNNSTDNTAAIARRYAKVVMERRKGIAAARNAGAGRAKGDILVFIDADTVPGRDMLVEVAKAFADSKVAMATGPIVAPRGSGASVSLIYAFSFNLLVRLSIALGRPYVIGNNLSIRRSVFDRIGGFDPRLATCEDGDISMRAARYGRTAFRNGIRVTASARRIAAWGAIRYMRYSTANVLGYLALKRAKSDYPAVRE